MKKLIKIESDVFFIVERIKQIDCSYEIYYNLHDKCYEVHSNEQRGTSYCFKVPYDVLDERVLWYTMRTRVENRDKILQEIEKDNLLLYEKKMKENVEILREIL